MRRLSQHSDEDDAFHSLARVLRWMWNFNFVMPRSVFFVIPVSEMITNLLDVYFHLVLISRQFYLFHRFVNLANIASPISLIKRNFWDLKN